MFPITVKASVLNYFQQKRMSLAVSCFICYLSFNVEPPCPPQLRFSQLHRDGTQKPGLDIEDISSRVLRQFFSDER